MVVNKLLLSFQISGNHFPQQMGKMVKLGSGSQREIQDYALFRYACYLIVQNADPSKSVTANGQTCFAIQTRRQELADDLTFQRLKEDEKCILLHNEMREYNKQLVEVAQRAGVETNFDFAIFQIGVEVVMIGNT